MSRRSYNLQFYIVLYFAVAGATLHAREADLSPTEVAKQDGIIAAEQSEIKSGGVTRRAQAFEKITEAIRANHGHGSVDPRLASESTKRAVTELLSYQLGKDPPLTGTTKQPATKSDAVTSEDLAGYTSALIQAVMELHDPSSIPLLYNADFQLSGAMAACALAYFGHTEAGRVVELFRHAPAPAYRRAMELVILRMLYQRTIDDPQILSQVEADFIQQTYSPHATERELAVTALSYFSDPKAKDRLRYVADHDRWVGVTALDHKSHYDIRNVATRALRGPIDLGQVF